MAWIEVHQSLWTHRKTFDLADRLKVSELVAASHLIALWTWSLDNAADSVLPKSERIVARGASWSGDADTFVDALIAAGWVDCDENGALRLHDWDDYAGKLIDQRRANAERQRARREQRRTCDVAPTSQVRRGATVPNPTVPNPTVPNHVSTHVETGGGAAAPVATAVAPLPAPEPFKVVYSEPTAKAATKPNKLSEVIDAIKAEHIGVNPSPADAAAVKKCPASAEQVAHAYVAAFRGEWPAGDTWLRDNLSLQAVCKRIDGYEAFRRGGGARASPGKRGYTAEELAAMAKGMSA